MGLNPLIAARSYIFHVFFILPQESEINILLVIHGQCVFSVFLCVSSCLSVLKVSPSTTKFCRLGEKSRCTLSVSPHIEGWREARGQQGAVVCLCVLPVHPAALTAHRANGTMGYE